MINSYDENYKKAFAERLKQSVANKGVTRKSICEQIYFSEKAMWELCKGKRKPRVSTVKLLAEALDVDYDWLMWGIDE